MSSKLYNPGELNLLLMNLSKGVFPSQLRIPAYVLAGAGFLYAGFLQLTVLEVLPGGFAIPWTCCLIGLIFLGQTKEKTDDERVTQLRNYSHVFLSGYLIGTIFYGSFSQVYLGYEVSTGYTLPYMLIFGLLLHVIYLKLIVHYDALDEASGKLNLKSKVIFTVCGFFALVLNVVIWP